ncbi:MAG: macro domain-containing protein [Anaerolineales bacterium]|nr:macro domain-containing protein [Anaerolineales bacterium]MCS7247837.1 macro domain-containing protein [Anaerolineales bacterium]MDW8161647.1 macro domain-containing protein [Anaerolineales bacterium]MDW8447482.1 macro domain-containing protein [Anaerolineales bacterium]
MAQVVAEKVFSEQRRLQLVQGDITAEEVDAIVNAANRYLQHGGGVAGAIVRRGGSVIQEESDRWVREHGPVAHDSPAYTTAGQLPCRYVIHAVGPMWGEGDEDEKLCAAVRGSLRVAEQLGCASLALPAISTGIFGFPKERAARLILRTLADYFDARPSGTLKTVRVTLLDPPTLSAFQEAWQELWGSPSPEA